LTSHWHLPCAAKSPFRYVASFPGGHAEGAYAMYLRIPQSSSEQPRCFTSVILPIQPSSTHRACIVLGARFVQRRMPPPASGSTCVWIFSRLTGGVLILRRVFARTIQTSANTPRERWGSPHGALQQGGWRRNAQLRGMDAITSSQNLLHLLVEICRTRP
jgi:hypothetical protein